jgi:hypothetical protein
MTHVPPNTTPEDDDDALWSSADEATAALLADHSKTTDGGVSPEHVASRKMPPWFEYNAPPSVLARSFLRQAIYEMTDAELAQLKADMGKLLQDVMKRIEAETGRSFWVDFAERLAEHFTDEKGRVDFPRLHALAAQLRDEKGGFQLRYALSHLYPKAPMEWTARVPDVQTRDDWGYREASHEAWDELAVEHKKLVARIEAGTATHIDRLEELVRRAELQTAEELTFRQDANDAAELRLRQQEVEAIVWALNAILRPTAGFPKGKVSKPMQPHLTDAVRRLGAEKTKDLKPVTGLDQLLDCLSFKN